MTHLEELEKRVLHIVMKNNELNAKMKTLESELFEAKEKNNQLEASLMREMDTAQSLVAEKNSVKSSIEQLLGSINALEDAS